MNRPNIFINFYSSLSPKARHTLAEAVCTLLTAVMMFFLFRYLLKVPAAVALCCVLGGLTLIPLMIARRRLPAVSGFLFERGHYRAAEFFLKRLAGKDGADSLTKLGDIYYRGLGRKKDWRKAAAFYGKVLALDTVARKAVIDVWGPMMAEEAVVDWADPLCLPQLLNMAEEGQPEACRAVGLWHQENVLAPDKKKARDLAEKYFRRAAERGDKEAEELLKAF